jgi:hypothetical protein
MHAIAEGQEFVHLGVTLRCTHSYRSLQTRNNNGPMPIPVPQQSSGLSMINSNNNVGHHDYLHQQHSMPMAKQLPIQFANYSNFSHSVFPQQQQQQPMSFQSFQQGNSQPMTHSNLIQGNNSINQQKSSLSENDFWQSSSGTSDMYDSADNMSSGSFFEPSGFGIPITLSEN